MSEDYGHILDAATALRALGHTVELDNASERWLINGDVWVTNAHLQVLAVRLGLIEGPWRLH